MKKALAWLLTAVWLFWIPPAEADRTEGLPDRMDRLMKSYHTVGASVIAARDGEIFFRYVYGYEDLSSHTPVSMDTHFRIASVTKMISAIRVMQLVEEGKLSLDRDISEYLGYEVRNPYRAGILTLRMLMSHTSSLAGGTYQFENRTVRNLIGDRRLNQSRFLKQAPGAKYRYSNLGAGLMGVLIEKSEGVNVDTSVKDGVFSPLNIDAGYSMKTLADASHVASLYNRSGTGLQRGPKKWAAIPWDPKCDPERHYDITVGDLLIRPEDLCRLGMMLAAEGTVDGVRLLQPETVRMMMADQRGKHLIIADSPYGLCIHRDTRLMPGFTLYGHQGHMWGTLCSLYWDPDTQLVILLVSNGCDTTQEKGTARLAEEVWRLLWQEYMQGGAQQ